MDAPLSAVQLLYSGIHGGRPGAVNEDAACHICGGPLLLPSKPASSLSGAWTDENLCRRRDSDKICAACAWFTEGKNRTRIWHARPVLYAAENNARNMTVPELYDLLQGAFDTPAVFMVRGRDVNLIKRHIQWRILDAVTWSRKRLNILYYGLELWKDSDKVTGTAVTSAERLIELVDTMRPEAAEYTKAVTSQLKKKNLTEWRLQNTAFDSLLRACAENITPEIYLAAYVASYLVAKDILESEVA